MGYTQNLWIVWWRAAGTSNWRRGPIVPSRWEAISTGRRHAAAEVVLERFARLDTIPRAPGMGEAYTAGGKPKRKPTRRRLPEPWRKKKLPEPE